MIPNALCSPHDYDLSECGLGDRLSMEKATFPRAPAGEVTIVAAMGLL